MGSDQCRLVFDVDEQFYALVGQRLLAGDLLYVDIWDRKPPALYLLYSGLSLISRSFLFYHLAATLSAALGAYGIVRIAVRITGRPGTLGGILAGMAYLALLNRFGGASGQAPVWFNTLMIYAAWTIVTRMEDVRAGRIDPVLASGMLSAGLAIAFKQSAAAECAFFGLWIAYHLVRSRCAPLRIARQIGVLALCGALPMAITFAWYWHIGHFTELWHALVESNYARTYADNTERLRRLVAMFGQLGMPLVFAVLGWMALDRRERETAPVRFLVLWAIVALLALAAFPNIYYHYALPVLLPLGTLCSVFFARREIRYVALGVLVVVNLAYGNSFDLVSRYKAKRDTPAFVDYVRSEAPHRKLLVWGLPNYLYSLLETSPPSRLAFPPHFFEGAESGSSGIDERAELHRILAGKPEVVVVQKPLLARPLNQPNVDQIENYVRTCSRVKRFTIYDHNGAQGQVVYSACGAHPSR